MLRVDAPELDRMVVSPHGRDELAEAELVLVTGDPVVDLAGVPAVLTGTSKAVDVVHDDAVAAAVGANPYAAIALAVLLRGGEARSVAEGLVAESATYALLQAGPEHRRWLAAHPPSDVRPIEPDPPVRVEREGDELRITLDRPHVRNAYSAAMRDFLVDALAVAAADPDLVVVLAGAGDSFSAGGDLDEFGTVPDVATAHLLRLRRNAGLALHAVADRTEVRVHGPCVGAGVELPAFAARVVAHPDTTFRLPEVAMGLVPGAGGTVSIPRRIGRRATAHFAITGRALSAQAAVALGLVDELGH